MSIVTWFVVLMTSWNIFKPRQRKVKAQGGGYFLRLRQGLAKSESHKVGG